MCVRDFVLRKKSIIPTVKSWIIYSFRVIKKSRHSGFQKCCSLFKTSPTLLLSPFVVYLHWQLQVSRRTLKSPNRTRIFPFKLVVMSLIWLVGPLLKIWFSSSAEKTYTFSSWMWKQPYCDKHAHASRWLHLYAHNI